MKKVLFALFVPLCLSFATNAQVIYHDINPDTTISSWEVFSPCFAGQAHTSTGKYIDIWFHPTPEVVINPNGVEILYDATGTYPAKLKLNDSITPAGQWKAVPYDPLNSAGTGNWTSDATDKYLGFRFNSGGIMEYGWVKLTVASGAASFTAKEWAYRLGKINAGQTNTTSVQHIVENNIELVMQNRQLSFSNLLAGHDYTVIITGVNGRVVKRGSIETNTAIGIADLATGVYAVKLVGAGMETSFKIGVQ